LAALLTWSCGTLAATPAETAEEPDRAAGAQAPGEPLRAGFLIVDGVYNTELMAPWDVFQHTVYQTQPGIQVFTVSPDGEMVTTAEGLRILPDHGFDDAPPIDILVVPSAENSRGGDLENREMIDWVRRTGERAQVVMSLCWGAFVLAEAGLLDGRSCTTFPRDYKTFAERFPDTDLHVNVSFVHDGKALTSEGGARSYDAAMYLVDRLLGEEVAKGVGGGLLIPWPPAAGHAGFVRQPPQAGR
jgi:transcriptional regulator GlxA family with amidase domain